MQDLKVALVQTKQFWENKLLNFEHFDMHLNSISEEEVDLILLPEMFNTSFSMNVHQLAESMTGQSINWLINWAKRLNCSIGASLIIEENNCFYNRFVIVDQQGIQAKYDKRHLFRMANEDQAFTAGMEKIILNLKGWNLLLQTCYDLRFPVFTRNYSIDGALAYDAILYVANWPAKRAMVWKCLLQARAIENQVFVLGVNRVGEDGNQITYAGDSAIINPWGNKLQIAQENQETILFGCLKHDDILEIRSKFPAYLDADPLV